MKIFLASDHAGFDFKAKLSVYLTKAGYRVEDVGNKELDPQDDYPQFAYAATTALLGGGEPEARAILVCGSGQGMCIAANRVPGIRASLCWSEAVARETREDNDSNVLCLPARVISEQECYKVVDAWLSTPFSQAPRHIRRIREIEDLRG